MEFGTENMKGQYHTVHAPKQKHEKVNSKTNIELRERSNETETKLYAGGFRGDFSFSFSILILTDTWKSSGYLQMLIKKPPEISELLSTPAEILPYKLRSHAGEEALSPESSPQPPPRFVNNSSANFSDMSEEGLIQMYGEQFRGTAIFNRIINGTPRPPSSQDLPEIQQPTIQQPTHSSAASNSFDDITDTVELMNEEIERNQNQENNDFYSGGYDDGDDDDPPISVPEPSPIHSQPSSMQPQPPAINPQPPAINPQPPAINPQTSPMNHEPSPMNHEPSPMNPSAIINNEQLYISSQQISKPPLSYLFFSFY